jgi:protein-disulfide isomerase
MENKGTKQIVGAIVLAGAMIAGAILIRGSSGPSLNNPAGIAALNPPAGISKEDRILGNPKAPVAVIIYADFQCPFCGAVSGLLKDNAPILQALKQRDPNWSPFTPMLLEYAKAGKVQIVYREFPFLGTESFQASEAAMCANDQGKFWEYHDYLYSHQNGENEGAFSDANLRSFAKDVGLDQASFDSCFTSDKYEQAVLDAKAEATNAGVTGTPKGFILKKGKVVSTIDGAEPASSVKTKIDAALK